MLYSWPGLDEALRPWLKRLAYAPQPPPQPPPAPPSLFLFYIPGQTQAPGPQQRINRRILGRWTVRRWATIPQEVLHPTHTGTSGSLHRSCPREVFPTGIHWHIWHACSPPSNTSPSKHAPLTATGSGLALFRYCFSSNKNDHYGAFHRKKNKWCFRM